MKTQIQKSILICLLAYILSNIKADAQIVYTDVIPDITSTGSYNLDLNNDGSTDFVIKHTTSNANGSQCTGSQTNNYIKASPSGNNAIAQTYNSYYNDYYVNNTPLYSTINASTLTWSSVNSQVMSSLTWSCSRSPYGGNGYNWFSNWSGQYGSSDGFMALKLTAGTNVFFGWLHIITAGSSFTVKDYAYNSTPGQAILAGQTSENYITASAIAAGPYCAGGNVSIPFTIYGTFSTSNIVTAQLSDANGNFASPVTIGSIVSNVSGNINAVVPANTPQGNNYRIRVTTTNPARISYQSPSYVAVSTLLPTGVITTGASTNICEGSVMLRASSLTGYSFQWKLNGNNISGATYNYYLATVTGDYSCTISTVCGSITTNSIAITSSPVATTITASGSTTICSGSFLRLYAENVSGNIYQWKLNGNDILSATAYNYDPQSTGTYSCTVTNSCGSVLSNAISVAVNPVPVANINTSYTGPVCSGSVTLNAPTGSGLTYQWQSYDDYNYWYNNLPATGSSYSAANTGIYRVVVYNSYGCNTGSARVSIEIGLTSYITVYPSTTICQGGSANTELDANSNNSGSFSYQWYKDGVVISGATNWSYFTKIAGSYTVKLTRQSDGCSTTSGTVTLIKAHCRLASHEVVTVESHLNIYPNPISNTSIISFSITGAEKVSVQIFDISGRLISVVADKVFDEGEHEVSWNASEVNAGIYFMRIEAGDYSRTEKISVVR